MFFGVKWFVAHCTLQALYISFTDPSTHYTLHTAHFMLYTLHILTQVQTTHYTVHTALKVWSMHGQGGLSGSKGGTAQYCIVLHYTTLGLLLFFTLLHSNIWYYSAKLRRSTLFYSCMQFKAFDTLLVLQIVQALFLLLVMPTFKFNLWFDDSMPVGIMEKKLFMENL